MSPPRDGQGDRQAREARVVPVYAITRKRTRTRAQGPELPLETVVTAAGPIPAAEAHALQVEGRAIVALCARPASIVEIAAALGVPVGVARVLVGDLAAAGHVRVHQPDHAGRDDGPGQEILGRLLDGLRAR